MTLAAFQVKHGRIEALNAIGQKILAKQVLDAEQLQKSVVDQEGIIPFEQRPASTQARLNKANEILFKADNLLWDKRTMSLPDEE